MFLRPNQRTAVSHLRNGTLYTLSLPKLMQRTIILLVILTTPLLLFGQRRTRTTPKPAATPAATPAQASQQAPEPTPEPGKKNGRPTGFPLKADPIKTYTPVYVYTFE